MPLRDRWDANTCLMAHYFNENSVYMKYLFRRRFRMTKHLFLRIVGDVTNISAYIRQRRDARGAYEFSEIKKCTVTIHHLAYNSVLIHGQIFSNV